MFSAPHTATARRLVQTYSLTYGTGTAVFTAGATVTGGTSHATATVVSTGSAGSGTLVIHTITGTFQSGETLDDNNTVPGHAHSTSVATIVLDSYGQPSKTNVDTTIYCRFFSMTEPSPMTGEVTYGQDSLYVMLPPTAGVVDGDTLVSTNTGYVATYTINELKPAYALGSLHHYTAKLGRLS